MRPSRLPVAALLALALLGVGSGCGDDGEGAGEAQVGAAATTTQVADLVRNVGGGRVEVDGIVPANADPHDYEPRPSDAAALADSDLVFRSGGHLDEWLDEVIESAGGDAKEFTLIDSVKTIAGEQHEDEETDPHWWQDPRNAILAVAAVRDALIEADPGGRAGYQRRAAAYTGELRRLDGDIERCIDKVPAGKRKLVTTHDALGYFADRYGVVVIGAVIPSLSTQAQPSAKDVEELVNQIEDEGVEAIFPEVAVSQKLEQAISREAGAEVGEELWTDTLGPDGSGAETYVDAMGVNAAALARGMSGGRVTCSFSR